VYIVSVIVLLPMTGHLLQTLQMTTKTFLLGINWPCFILFVCLLAP